MIQYRKRRVILTSRCRALGDHYRHHRAGRDIKETGAGQSRYIGMVAAIVTSFLSRLVGFLFDGSASIFSSFFPDVTKDSIYLPLGGILMNIHVKRLGMLLIMGSCLKASALAAQSPVPTQQSQVTQVNGTVVVTPNVEPSPEPSRNRPLQRFLNPHGMGCASDFNAYGCGNFWSNFDFMFGSCRTFFGQTCTPNTSHNGAGTAAGTQRNCANGSCGN